MHHPHSLNQLFLYSDFHIVNQSDFSEPRSDAKYNRSFNLFHCFQTFLIYNLLVNKIRKHGISFNIQRNFQHLQMPKASVLLIFTIKKWDMKREQQHKHLGNPVSGQKYVLSWIFFIRETQTSAGTSWQDSIHLKSNISHLVLTKFNVCFSTSLLNFQFPSQFSSMRDKLLPLTKDHFTKSYKRPKNLLKKKKVLLTKKMEIHQFSFLRKPNIEVFEDPSNRTNNHAWKEKKFMLTSA